MRPGTPHGNPEGLPLLLCLLYVCTYAQTLWAISSAPGQGAIYLAETQEVITYGYDGEVFKFGKGQATGEQLQGPKRNVEGAIYLLIFLSFERTRVNPCAGAP